jgi:toxin CptA
MPKPPSVHVVLGPSRAVGAAIGVATLATSCVVLILPLPSWLHGAACALLLAWAWVLFQVLALRRGPFAVTEVRLAPDLVLVVNRGDGRLTAGHVRSSTFVAAWLTTIVWRPDGARFSRSILIVPDMLPADDFRRLRVMLRYARSGEVQETPLSQC